MKIDEYGYVGRSVDELTELLRINPTLDISNLACIDPEKHNTSVKDLFLEINKLKNWNSLDRNIIPSIFHYKNQQTWEMPEEFKKLDIEDLLIKSCKNDVERTRISNELKLYKEFNLINLLRYMAYLVDILNKNKIILGVGRGSSVSSYVLYKLGVHKIDSIKYNLDIKEFLRKE